MTVIYPVVNIPGQRIENYRCTRYTIRVTKYSRGYDASILIQVYLETITNERGVSYWATR